MWSSPMPVIATERMLCAALVASQRPPMPHSSTHASTPASAKTTMAATVSTSNSVMSYGRSPAASRRAFTRSPAATAAATPRANCASLTGWPATSMRSVMLTSSGEVYSATRSPSPPRTAAVKRAVEVLPFVPAICTLWKRSSGLPSSASMSSTLSSMGWMPKRFVAARRAIASA